MSGSPRRNTPSGGDPGGAFSRQRTSSDVNRTNDGGNLPPGVSPLRYLRSLDRGSRMLQVHAPVLASARYEKDGKLPPLNFRSPPTRHEQRRDDSDIGPETVHLPPLNSPTSSASSRRPPQPGLPTTEHERRCETAERLRRLGIDPDTARRLQTFSPEQVEVGAGHVLAVLWPEGTSEGGRKKGSTLQELQDEIERCRIANEEMKRAVNDERERYGATIRDLKLLCLTQDDAEVARTQSRLRQYHGLRQTLAEKSPVPDSAAAESDRFVLDQIAMLNAELELALAEKQAQKQKRSLNGLRGQPLTVDNRGCRSTSAQKAGQRFAPEMESPGLHQELLISVTTLQQENQRLYEENVQIRRALAAHGKATGTSQGPAGALLSGPAPPARHPLVPRATERAAPIPKVSDGYPLRSRRAPGGRACMSQWSKLLRGRDGEDRILSEAKLRRFLEQEGAVLSPSFSQADIAKSLLIVYRNTHEKMKYYRRRNRVLQTKLSKQRRRVPDSRKRQDGKEVDIGDEAFSLEWKVGTLEAEISRLRRSLELSTGTCLSLATIHNFFLEQKAILQRQLEGERADIESLEDECGTMKEMRLLCFAEEEENAEAGGDILNSLVGEAGETGHQTRRGTGLSGRSDGVEEAFLAAYEAVMNAVEALKTRHAQTAARLAQIQTGLISVEQDLKILDREQRAQLEKHMQDLADRGAESEGGGAWTRKPCYVRQAIGPGSADREAQTDNSGIASRRHLYTGDFPVSDSTTALVTVSIINEEDVVVKLMLEDMEFPLCLYTAIAAIRFPEGSRTGEGGASSEKGGHMSRLAKEGGTSPLSDNARRETRRNVVKRRRLADETDGKLIATMLEVECVRGSPCLILKDQQEPAAPTQEPRPFISYVEDCLYNDKLSFDHVLLVCGTPLSLIMIQCAKRRYGMMFFHLCMYNNLSGWVKYVSLPSKEICRRFGHSGDRQLLEALGGLKRSGKVAETATVGTLIKLFEESFASDAKAAATSASASPSSRPFEPEVLVLCGSLTLGEKSEILKEQKLQAAKLKQTSRKSKRLDAQRTPLGLDASLSVSMQDYSVARTTSALGLNSSPFAEEKPDEAFVFLQLKICIDWDGYLDVSFEFEN